MIRWLVGLTVILLGSMVLAISVGSVRIPPDVVAAAIGHRLVGYPAEISWPRSSDAIVWLVRLPRVLLAVVVGAGLAISGVVLQALSRNVLAEPYLIGVASGASVGAAVAILFGLSVGGLALGVPLAAFVGALAAMLLVFGLAGIGGTFTPARLVLAGITVSYALSALTSFLVFAVDARDGARAVLFWLLGSLARADWADLTWPGLTVLASSASLWWWSRSLDAVAIGDDTALSLGVDPGRFRVACFALVALGVGAVVAVAGPIGFVGLVVPHLARGLVGGLHQRVLPVAALLGAVLMLWADIAARTLFAPQELPLGVVTALVGAPFLLFLVLRAQRAT
ncbi:MAG: FecCD family ABC transporter permease [Nocardioides sp.]